MRWIAGWAPKQQKEQESKAVASNQSGVSKVQAARVTTSESEGPLSNSLRSLTPPRGESIQNRTVGPIAQPDTLEGGVILSC